MQYKIFWCKVNKYYLNQRLSFFADSWVDTSNLFLISTCEVTDRAKSKWLSEAKRALKSWMKIAITGCWTLKEWEKISESDFYSLYPELEWWRDQIEILGEKPIVEPDFVSTNIFTKQQITTKHFLMIQNGCDNYCSFCLTVLKRWKHWSRPLNQIVDEIKRVEDNGCNEIVLTGVNLAARWCSDTKKPSESRFNELLYSILIQTNIPRIRISSLGPEYINQDFFDIIWDKRIMPHFHYSIQSFSEEVLQRMGRNYDYQQLVWVLQKTREIDRGLDTWNNLISIGADLIVGFPWETEVEFEETLRWVEGFNITKLHVFPFSEHQKWQKIPAFYFSDQVPFSIKKEREKKLIGLGDQIRTKFLLANKGTAHDVMIEERKNGKWHWWTDNYLSVELEGDFTRWQILKDFIWINK